MGNTKCQGVSIIFILGIGCLIYLYYWFTNQSFLQKTKDFKVTGEVANNIIATLTAYGLEPEVQKNSNSLTKPSENLSLKSLWAANTQNIYATISGTNSSGTIMLMTNYHTTLSARDSLGGKNSNYLLNLVRAIKRLPPLKNDIILFFSNADFGNYGGDEGNSLTNPIIQQNEVVLKITDQDLTEKPLIYFSNKQSYCM